MLKYIIAFIVIAIVWAVVLVLNLPWTFAIIATLLVFFVLLAIWGWRRWRAVKAAREIEKALNAQAEEQVRAVRPEQQAEVRAMQAEVNRAISALKTSRLGKGGADALYALPWYVIIGPPGSGKTTALKNSGIPFPYISSQTGGGVRGVGGTRNCEWWLTNEGVLLDTAGRYTTEDDDRDEWLSFLDLLKKNRPNKPLNGVIVAVNVAELASSREQQIEGIARRVRERVDEVQARLQLSLPVYVLFTKCDLVQGFSEFFDDLRKSERGQIWGFTVPLARAAEQAAPSGVFNERFEEMVRGIEGRMLKRLGQEPGIPRREGVYQFPQQFASLKSNLADFLDALFASNVYQSAPHMRGVYFTSGTQEGRPIDQLAEKLRASFGLPAAAATAVQQPTEAKSFFLRDVFARVVFPDSSIAALSAGEIARQKKQKYYIAAGAFGLAALLSIIPANAYLENREMVGRCDRASQLIREHVAQRANTPLTLGELQPLRDVVSELKGYHDGHAPIAMGFGMFQGENLYPKMSALYATAMQQHVINPLYLADVRDLNAFTQRIGDAAPSTAERGQFYDVLKLHLLLSQPKQTGEPELEGEVAEFTATQLAREWAGRVSQQGVLDGRTQEAMRQNAQLFTGLLHDNPRLALARQQNTVVATRTALNRTSTIDLALERIVTETRERGFEDMTLARAIGRSPEHIYQIGTADTHRIRGAFTRAAWDGFVRERLRQAPERIVGEAWVLGQVPNEGYQQRMLETLVQVRSQYFSQYIAEWRNFLSNLRVREPGTPEVALQMLGWFTQGAAPAYVHLTRTVGENTRLNDPNEQSASAASATALQVIEREINNRLNRSRSGQAAGQITRAGLAGRTVENGPTTFIHREDVERDGMLHGIVTFGVPPAPAPRPAGAAGAEPAAPPPPPGPTDLTAYQEQLAFVRDDLTTYLANPRTPAVSQQLLDKLSAAQTRVQALINGSEVDSRPVLRNLLPPPIDFTVRRAMGALGGAGSDRWCSAVVVPFVRTLQDHYPFNPNGQDAALTDMTQFYSQPRGALWAFYAETLTNDVPRVGDEYQFSTRLGQDTGTVYLPVLRDYLNRSQDITTVLFPPPSVLAGATPEAAAGGGGPSVDFEVRIRPTPTIAETTFAVDGQEVRYTNGPEEWHRFHWPAQGRERGARIRARGLNGVDETIEQDGEWGIYRLFELGQVRGSANSRVFSVVWHLRDQNIDVGVDVRPARSENPFFGVPRRDASADRFMSPFRGANLNAPHPIARTARPCNLSSVPRTGGQPAASEGSSRRHRRRH